MLLHAISEFAASLPIGATVTTVEIWEAVHGADYIRDEGAAVSTSDNAAFGRLISKHAKDLGLAGLAEEPAKDRTDGRTTTMRWAKVQR